jgi:hypothetical protein
MGARRLRIKLERRSEQLACGLIGRERSLAKQRHSLDDQRIDGQSLVTPTSFRQCERLQLGVQRRRDPRDDIRLEIVGGGNIHVDPL